MSKAKTISIPFENVLLNLLAWFQKCSVPGIIIGGVALSLLGRPRVTKDIDALLFLDASNWDSFLKMGSKFGFAPRIKDVLDFAQKKRVLLMKHLPSDVPIDISFGALPFEEESVQRALKLKVKSFSLPFLTPEDFIIMKAVAHRTRDLADIETVLDAYPKLDFKRIRKWVKEFAEALEMPEIYDDLNKLIKKKGTL